MNKFTQALHSRTAWTALLLVVVNIIPNLGLSPELRDLLNAVLGALVIYFRVNASNVPTTPTPPQ